jgi:hypothetical protein
VQGGAGCPRRQYEDVALALWRKEKKINTGWKGGQSWEVKGVVMVDTDRVDIPRNFKRIIL